MRDVTLVVAGVVLSVPALTLWIGTGWMFAAAIVLLSVPLIVGGSALRISSPDRRLIGPTAGWAQRAPVDEMVGESR